jgi:hypothetical protein
MVCLADHSAAAHPGRPLLASQVKFVAERERERASERERGAGGPFYLPVPASQARIGFIVRV